jgi:hypothetical protein
MISIGSNKFENCAVPLVFEDRYFVLESERGTDTFRVFTFYKGEPVENPLSEVKKNPTGTITVSDPASGRFLYKIRPGDKNSSVFGTIAGEEEEVIIRDRAIYFRGSVFSENIFLNVPVGIRIKKDGGVALGAQFPPEFARLIERGGNLIRHEGKEFNNETVRLDGNNYVRCVFRNCQIQFGGTDNVGLDTCEFYECKWTFVDAAQRTLEFMAAMYHGMGDFGKDLVEKTFENIKKRNQPKI